MIPDCERFTNSTDRRRTELPNWFENIRRRCLCVLSLLLIVFLPACGFGGPDLVSVSGQVTVDGQPLNSGRIQFFPESGRPAGGEIDKEGRYRLSSFGKNDGVIQGDYIVTITATKEVAGDQLPQYNSMEDELSGNINQQPPTPRSEQSGSGLVWLAPQRYANRATTDLTAEVTDGDQVIDFELHSLNAGP